MEASVTVRWEKLLLSNSITLPHSFTLYYREEEEGAGYSKMRKRRQ